LDAGKRVTLAKKSDALGGFWQNLLSRNESLEDLAQFIAMRGAA
jgi:hypothetical protein